TGGLQQQGGCQDAACFLALRPDVGRDVLLCQDGFRRLGAVAADEGRRGFTQPPAGGDAFHLALCPAPVGSCRDQQSVGSPRDPVEYRIIVAVEELLHLPADRAQVFRRTEQIPGGFQQPVRVDLRRSA